MTIAVGERIPDVQLRLVGDHGIEQVSTAELLGKGRVVLLACRPPSAPRAPTSICLVTCCAPTSSLPEALTAIFCASVNDPLRDGGLGPVPGHRRQGGLLADGNGELAQAMGLEIDLSRGGLGTRNRRYAPSWRTAW